MSAIKKCLSEIETMIPSRFNFDFGKKENIGSIFSKINEGQDEGYYEEIKRSVYEIYDTTSDIKLRKSHTLELTYNTINGKYYRWRISPTLELIIKYRDIVFQNGRTYVVGKTKARITDIISLFEYLQTTRNYAIFNNLLNVMLIFIIDYVLDILKGDGRTSTKLIDDDINEHYRKLYSVVQVEQVEEVRLVNAFIYGIDDALDVNVEFEWNALFLNLVELLKKKESNSLSSPPFETQKSTSPSSPPDKEKDKNKLIEELKYNMAIGVKLITSCQYKYIMKHIREYATTADTYVVDIFDKHPTAPLGYLGYRKLKLIYTHDKYMTQTSDGCFVDLKDDRVSPYVLNDEEMYDEIHKIVKPWKTQPAFISSITKGEQIDAENAYSKFLEACKKKTKYIEATYNRYAETVSKGIPALPLRKVIGLTLPRPFSTSYDRYIAMLKVEEEKIANDRITTPLLPVQYSKITPFSYSMENMKVIQANIQTKGKEGKVYIYPTLSAIKADINKKTRLNKDDILKKLSVKIIYSSDNKIYVSFTNDILDTYNNVVVTTDSTWTKESTRNEWRVKRDKPEVRYEFSGPLLYKNKQLVKELYNTIKRYKEAQKKSDSSSSGGGKKKGKANNITKQI